jgi:hypothetical protein
MAKLHVIRNIKSDAVLMGHGKSSDRFVDRTLGTHNFWQLYTKCLNASGINRGLRLDITVGDGVNATTATTEALRAYVKSDSPTPAGAIAVSGFLELASGALASSHTMACANFTLQQTAGSSVSGGRGCVMNLHADWGDTGYTGTPAACSFINFADDGYAVSRTPALFTLPNHTPGDGTNFETNTHAASHGLVVYIGNVKYWLLVSDTHT